MFDIGWSEMAVIALVTLVVFGPKELPAALRTGAKLMRQGRKLAREFQGSVDQLIKEAELEEVKNLATAAKRGRLDRELEKVIDPTGELKQAVDANAVKRELNADGTSLPAPAPTAPAQTAPAPPPALAGPAAEPTPASSVGAVAAAPKAEAEPEPATPTAPAN
jgi:sec-independent protein translocase protein TatB